MDNEKGQNLFDEKYEKRLEMTYPEWLETAPQNEAAAYARLDEIDRELKETYEDWFDAQGEEKEQMGEHRDKLKAEYDLLEELYNLEAPDKNW